MTIKSTSRAIFIVGPGRSGTSLLRTVLARHSRIYIAPETHFFDKWGPHLSADNYSESSWASYYSSAHFLSLKIAPLENTTSLKSNVEIFRNLTLSAAQTNKPSAETVGEKTPSHHFFVDNLLSSFKSSLVVFCIRDPRAVVGSMVTIEEQWANKSRVTAARKWLLAAKSFRANSDRQNVIAVRYEDLVQNTEVAVKPILDFFGYSWEPSMTSDTAKRAVHSNNSLISTSPIDSARTTAWRDRLSSIDVLFIESLCTKEMASFGYAPQNRPFLIATFKIAAWTLAAVGRLKNLTTLAVSKKARRLRQNRYRSK